MNTTKSECWSDPEFAPANWGARKGRPWTQFETDRAVAMRFRGAADHDIAATLGRSVASVIGKLGYQRKGA